MKKQMIIVAMLASLVGFGVVANPSPASASAFGCSGFRGINTPWANVSANQYCVTLNGSGTYVSSVTGSFTANVGNVCNYNITAEFFDTSGRWYMTRTGGTTTGCFWGTQFVRSVAVNQTVRPGYMCSTLKQNGTRLASVCHNIY